MLINQDVIIMLLKREVEGVSDLIDSMVKKPNIYNNVKYS